MLAVVNSRDKGKRGELEAAKAWEKHLGLTARRGQQFKGGDESPDVAQELPGVHVEVKRVEALQLYPAVEQATKDSGGKVPVVLHRKNKQPWVAIIPLDRLADFAQLYVAHKGQETPF